jgi:hypothetical protein
MWGSDWPTQFERVTDYGATLRTLSSLGLDETTLDEILRTTPTAFYGFEPANTRSPQTLQEQPS